ncbi:MAG: GNAT family N-acetyltransferase [Caulobacterales bacterium]|nr:GNAT family N-acetyltransferase [Caulobacterales bacterium]
MPDSAAHPYAVRAYAQALVQGEGAAVEVDAWGACLLARPIADSGRFDALGAYPMTPMAADAALKEGLASLAEEGLVSVVLVPDPLASPPRSDLAAAFSLCRPFKTHFVVDRTMGEFAPNKHHRQEIRRALRRCRVETVSLAEHAATFAGLYGELIARHDIRGVAAFSDAYFVALADDARMTAFAAVVEEEIAAMTIWFEHEGVAYNHLGASNAAGYRAGANYALYDAAIAHFAGADRLNLGGSAGATDDPNDGLAFFKRGFANAEAQALLCGAVLDQAAYDALTAGRPTTGFFPAYRG